MVKPFGHEYNEECDRIRDGLVAEGWDPKDPTIIFEISKRYEAAHRYDEPFSVRSRRWREQQLAKHADHARITLTEEELEYLTFRLYGVNDPVGMSILDKLTGRS